MTLNQTKKLNNPSWVPPALPTIKNPASLSRYWIDHHNTKMQTIYPHFRVVFETSWGTAWKGSVQPASKKYDLLILYIPGADFQDISITERPVAVFVTSPLDRREDAPHEPIPHRYLSDQFHKLCLYHPTEDAWSPYKSDIADDIVSFALQWLLTYEFWLVTGAWKAPGAHPENKDEVLKTGKSINPKIKSSGKFSRYQYSQPLFFNMLYLVPSVLMDKSPSLPLRVPAGANFNRPSQAAI